MALSQYQTSTEILNKYCFFLGLSCNYQLCYCRWEWYLYWKIFHLLYPPYVTHYSVCSNIDIWVLCGICQKNLLRFWRYNSVTKSTYRARFDPQHYKKETRIWKQKAWPILGSEKRWNGAMIGIDMLKNRVQFLQVPL